MKHSGNLPLEAPEVPLLLEELRWNFNHYNKELPELIKQKFELILKISRNHKAIESGSPKNFLGFSKNIQSAINENVHVYYEFDKVEKAINHNLYQMDYLSAIINRMIAVFEIDTKRVSYTPIKKNEDYIRRRKYTLDILGFDEKSDDYVYMDTVYKYTNKHSIRT
jgi:hypothetical protein